MTYTFVRPDRLASTLAIQEKARKLARSREERGTHTCKRCGEKPLAEFRVQVRKSGNKVPRQHCARCEVRLCVERRRKREQAGVKRNRTADGITLARKQGREYIPRTERRRMAEERKALTPPKPPRTPKPTWVDRFKQECPQEYERHKHKPKNTLAWVARYHMNPVFKAKEIERVRRKKAVQQGYKMDSDGTLTGPVIQSLFANARRCPDCRKRLEPRDKDLDHIVPISKGGAHSILNVRVICKRCNTAKGAKMPAQLTLNASSHIHVRRPSFETVADVA